MNNETENSLRSFSPDKVDVVAILKAKTKIKEKTTVEKIVASAAKEMKAKKNALDKTIKKKKKKSRDKYAHGAPSR